MAAGSTYTPISTHTTTGTVSTYTFTSIPQTYTDLVLIMDAISPSAQGEGIALRFNGDTSSSYSFVYMFGNGTGTGQGFQAQAYANAGNASGVRSVNRINIQNYSSTNTYKTMTGRASLSDKYDVAYLSSWRSNSAITSINVSIELGATHSFSAGSTFTLYGIAAA